MIPQIKEINFPEHATISTATATLQDMGDKTISAQVKIDGRYKPDFSFDWEVEFQGERYIQPLREPQASKGNDSLSSVIDLTFQHWTIYQLKRYYFVQTAPGESGTAVADKYIASIGLNLGNFIEEFKRVLKLYFPKQEIIVDFNGKWEYDLEPSYMEISYSHIWDVLLKLHEVYGVHWSIDGNIIKVGYDTTEVSHTFEYGFEGGLLRVERQVQSADIRNSLLGRGGEKNLPYRYFKNVDEHNPSFPADPDWIPELENIYFSELRGKTFRDYVKGWKAKHYDGEPMIEPTEAYTKGYTDETFNPIEFVEDKESINKYGLLQGGLENQEDIYPSIQGVEVDGIGRVDEVVDAERVTVDEVDYSSNVTHSYEDRYVTKVFPITKNGEQEFEITSEPFSISQGMIGSIYDYLSSAKIVATGKCTYYNQINEVVQFEKYQTTLTNATMECTLHSIKFYNFDTNKELDKLEDLTPEIKIYYKAIVSTPNIYDEKQYHLWRYYYWDDETGKTIYSITPRPDNQFYYTTMGSFYRKTWYEFEAGAEFSINVYVPIYQIQFGGKIIPNIQDDEPISGNIKLGVGDKNYGTLVLDATDIIVEKDKSTLLDIPMRVDAYKSDDPSYNLKGGVEYRKNIILSSKETGERFNLYNIPKGEYYCRVEVECYNNLNEEVVFVAELLPTYLLPPTDVEGFQPTFRIWVKNIWNTTRYEGESDIAYVDRVWTPILGDKEGDTAKVVFTTGMLSGHSDYEFEIIDVAYDNSAKLGEVQSEWCITLAKSTAELEATGKYIPSTQIQAEAGNYFYFIGIDMPHEYVLWAEERLDQRKADKLLETANIKPTWVVQTDKVRLNEVRDGEKLLDSFKIGNVIKLADSRFITGPYEKLYLQSITYTWDAQTTMLPNVEVVLSDKVATTSNPISTLQGEVDALSKQVGSISNVQQIVRAIGDKLYLRKDGGEDTSYSPTTFSKEVHSKDYRQGAVGGKGWGLRAEQGKGILELDKLIVREEMQVNTLVINQVASVGGMQIMSAANIVCSNVEFTESGIICYFDQKRGSISNLFVVGDVALSMVYDSSNNEVKSYRREVIAIADNSITLSLDAYGNGAPQIGDVIVQYGNVDSQNYSDRQYAIVTDVIGGGYERMLSGLNSIDAEGEEYYFAGRMHNGRPRWFVGDKDQYVKFEEGEIAIECKQVGMTSEGDDDDAIRIWAGADNDNKGNARFRVLQDGRIFAKDAMIEGKIIATSGEFKGSIRSPFGKNITGDTVNAVDNFTLMSMFSPFYLPCDNAQSGRKLTLVGSGELKLDAPEATQVINFYDQGVTLKSISLNSEIIELIGYASEGAFMGWIVLNRRPYTRSNPQGRSLNPVAYGSVKYLGNTLTQKCFACDGSNLSIVRDGTGSYSLSIPSSLSSNIEDLVVHCSMTPTSEYPDYPVAVVAYKDISKSTIQFRMYTTSGSRMDGAFDFIIYPLKAWE